MRRRTNTLSAWEVVVMYKRILLPLDGSALAESALPLARRLTVSADGVLYLVQAVEINTHAVPAGYEFGVSYIEESYRKQRERASEYIAGRQGALRAEGVRTASEVRVGNPAEIIIETAEREAIDLIVMTTHGYRGLTRWMLGSVAERVLRHAPCPVLIVREDRPIQHILVPLDGSKLAEAALPHALALADLVNASVTLLRVDDTLSLMDYASIDALDQFEPGLADAVRGQHAYESEGYLSGIVGRLETIVPVRFESPMGDAVNCILETAERQACDLIVMSTHGRSGVRRWVYGSVTEKVLRSATQPLLVVRPDGRDEAA